jgi:hypothetical protein
MPRPFEANVTASYGAAEGMACFSGRHGKLAIDEATHCWQPAVVDFRAWRRREKTTSFDAPMLNGVCGKENG